MFSADVGEPKTSVGRKMDQSPSRKIDQSPAGRALVAGVVLALGALCRPVLLPASILSGVVLALLAYRRGNAKGDRSMFSADVGQPKTSSGRKMDQSPAPKHCFCEAVAHAAGVFLAFMLGAIIVLGPWAVRNRIQFGRPIVTTTHGGYTLLLANNPDFYHWLRTGAWGSVWWSREFDAAWDRRRPRDEVQADRLAYEEAMQTIRREPGTFVEACLVRLGRFWAPLPHQITPQETSLRRASRYGVAVWYAVEFALAIVGIVFCGAAAGTAAKRWSAARSRRDACATNHFWTWFWGLLFVACLTAVHTVYWTDMRMRAPVMPVVALAAAAGGAWLLETWKFSGRRHDGQCNVKNV